MRKMDTHLIDERRSTTRWKRPAKDTMLSGNLPSIAVLEQRHHSDGQLSSRQFHNSSEQSQGASETGDGRGSGAKEINNNNNSNDDDTDCPKTVRPRFRWSHKRTQRKPALPSAHNHPILQREQTMSFRKQRLAIKRLGAGKAPSIRPLLAATILILIAYELCIKLVTDYHHQQHIYTASTCRRCLPRELVFIKPCSAALASVSTTETATFNAATITSPNEEHVATILSANTTLSTRITQQLEQNNSNYTTRLDLPSNQTQAANLMTRVDNTTTIVNNITTVKLIQSGGDFIKRTAMPTVVNKLQQHFLHHHQTNAMPMVLCNSRCNCVILEPMITGQATNNASQPAQSAPPVHQMTSAKGGLAELTELWRDGAPNQGNQSAPVRSGEPSAASTYLANNGSSLGDQQQRQQQQLRAEQALIAFNEDYSLDYEHSPPIGNVVDDTGAPDVEPVPSSGAALATGGGSSDQRTTTAAAATKTRITNSMPADSVQGGSNIPMVAVQQQQQTAIANHSTEQATQTGPANSDSKPLASANGGGGGQNGAGLGASATTNPSDVLVVPGSSRQAQLQPRPAAPETSRNATPPSTTTNGSPINETTGSQGKSDGGSSGQPTKTAPLQQQQPGMTLFPLPNHLHNHLRAHHHPLQHQPLGAGSGRDANGPQLYAQSLYSSQAPKLSYHAHTPYLKSQVQSSVGSAGPILAAGQQRADSHQPAVPSTGAQATYPYQSGYSHMRSTYLSHHLRQLNPVGSRTSSVLLSGQTNDYHIYAPQQRVLVALKSLDLSAKLKRKSSSPPEPANDQTRDTNWRDSPQLISSVEDMLIAIEQDDIQSLILRDNEMQFELWSELYALLAVQMRQHLFHIDLSHNALAKLGITFTGYIEHHLAAHGSWPFGVNSNNSQSTADLAGLNEVGSGQTGAKQASKSAASRANPRARHTLLSGGKLYTLVQQRLVGRESFARNQNGHRQRQQVGAAPMGANLSHVSLLQQPLLVRALDLSHNRLKWLINDQFRALKYVQTIRLDHNRIRYIHQHAFSGLESLRFLNLNFNRLQVIYIEQFQTNYNLLALMLRSNYLTYLRGGSFASLANLKRLDISGNKLTVLSNNAFIGLESLELLNCSSNQFVHAPSASLHPLISLKRLDLSDNLISQLAPGTFFHLPLEELSLNQNEQLAAIDRGAFWDLPYLQRLHLESNPMLSSINSQAFVGTQSLQTIDVYDCQSLDDATKQMLENVTITATSRLLRNEQSVSPNHHRLQHSAELANGAVASNQTAGIAPDHLGKPPGENVINPEVAQETQQQSYNKAQSHSTTSSRHFMDQLPFERGSRLQTCIYYLGTVVLLVVALKLVFKFTSTGHYIEARRRRRRVFEIGKGTDEVDFDTEDSRSISHCSASEVFPMCIQSGSHMLGGSLNLQPRLSQQQTETVDQSGGSSIVEHASSTSHLNGSVDSAYATLYTTDISDEQQRLPDEQSSIENSINCSDDTNDVISEAASTQHLADESMAGVCCPGCSGSAAGLCQSLPLNDEQIRAGDQIGNQPVAGEDTSIPSTRCCELGNHGQLVHQQQQQHLPAGADLSGNQSTATIDLIHSQLIAAGFDYGHAHCAHFYQSLGPALQLADITANIVSSMDYY